MFTLQNIAGLKEIGLKVLTLDFVFKTAKDLTKSRRLYFGFTHLRVNEKINPVPKFSGIFRMHQEFGKITTSLRELTQNLKQSIMNNILKPYQCIPIETFTIIGEGGGGNTAFL